MSKHTPGPWIARKEPRNPYPDPPGDKWTVRAAGYWWVADIFPFARGWQDDSESKANALLIAASPTMYDYLASRARSGDSKAASILADINA